MTLRPDVEPPRALIERGSGQVAPTKRRREGCLQLAPFHSPTRISKTKGTAIAVPFALRCVDKKDAIRNIKSQTTQATGNYYTTERILQRGKDTPPPGHHIRESRELSM